MPAPPPPEVDVSLPVRQQVTDYLTYTGSTAAVEYVEVLARVKGFLESIHFEPRQKVKKNDLLFVIDPREYKYKLEQAEAELAGRKVLLELAAYELKRIEGLFNKSVAAEYERDTAIARLNSAKADVAVTEAAVHQAQLNLDYTQVKAPISGRVNRNFIDVGNLVDSDKTILTNIVNDESIYVYFNVSERDLLDWISKHPEQAGRTASKESQYPVYMGLANEPDFPHQGVTDYADTRVDPGTGTLRVRAIFPNPDSLLLPGLFARVRIPADTREALLVPAIAIGADQSGRYLLVVNGQNVVEQRQVHLGQAVGRLRVIASGLKPADRVIVSGLQRARPGSPVSPKTVSVDSYLSTAPAGGSPIPPVATKVSNPPN